MKDLPSTSMARAETIIEEGHTYRSVSSALGVSTSVVHYIVRRYKETVSYVRRRGQEIGQPTPENTVLLCVRNLRETAVQTVARLAFAREYRNWTTEWCHVFFADKSHFVLISWMTG